MNQDKIIDNLEMLLTNLNLELGFTPKCYIAGGCIASMVLDEPVKDFDVWFEMPEDFEAVELAVKARLPFTESKYALTITMPITGHVVQFVKSRMGVAEVLVPGFDFLHTQSYYKQDGTLVYDEALIKSKKLLFVKGNFKHPVNTVQRMLKFARRGYDIPFETVRDIMEATNDLEPNQISGSTKHAGSM